MAQRRGGVRKIVLDDIGSGASRPGDQVKVATLAARSRLSAIPVREALFHMVGEDILSERPGIGFFVPRLHAHELAQVYRFRLLLVTACATASLKAGQKDRGRSLPNNITSSPTADAIFDALVATADDTMIAASWARTGHRLLPYRRCEPAPDTLEAAVVHGLDVGIAAGDAALVKRVAGRHLRRRERQSEAILRCANAR